MAQWFTNNAPSILCSILTLDVINMECVHFLCDTHGLPPGAPVPLATRVPLDTRGNNLQPKAGIEQVGILQEPADIWLAKWLPVF